jgi:hypothetical protein
VSQKTAPTHPTPKTPYLFDGRVYLPDMIRNYGTTLFIINKEHCPQCHKKMDQICLTPKDGDYPARLLMTKVRWTAVE